MARIWLRHLILLEAVENAIKEGIKTANLPRFTPRAIHVMYELFKEDGLTVNELAYTVRTKPTGFTPVLDRLVQMRLIERRRSFSDGRVVNVFLLPGADKYKNAIIDLLDSIEVEKPAPVVEVKK